MRAPRNRAQVDDLLVMGRITAPYGVKGWLRVNAYTESPENLLDYVPWQLAVGDEWREVQPLDGRPHGKGLVVQLAECADRDAAALLAGTDIAIHRSQLPDTAADEYYWSDLIGLQVVTAAGKVLGRIDHLLETGANDVLVVRNDRERLIPYIRGEVIKSIDLDSGVVRVDWDPDF